jgi:glutamine synthetase
MVDAAREEAGLGVLAGFEGEFSLCAVGPEGPRPADATNCFAAIGMMEHGDLALAMVDALEAVGVPVLLYTPELGHGQHEIATGPAPAVAAADRQLMFRETVRAVARRHGLAASFAPKPFADQAGNGAHLHWSLWDPDCVVPRQWRGNDLSDVGGWFQAGVLAHLPGLLALTCPSVNSYRRIRPGAWASATVSWGAHNKEAAVRLLPPGAGSNAELKACDHSCNPYLALGGLIACGLDGVRARLPLPPEATDDPAGLRGVAALPGSLKDALDALEADEVLTAAMGPVLHGSYLAVKRSEVAAFEGRDEIPDHIFRY